MKRSKFPIRNLIRLNLGMAVISFSLVFAFMYLFLGNNYLQVVIFFSLFAFITLALKVFINLGVLLFLEKRLDINSSLFKKLRFSLSMLLNICADSAIFIAFAFLNERLFTILFLLILAFIIFAVNIIIILLQDYVILTHFKGQSDLENSKLRTARAEAANQLLRQQIHPHFLFNALNTLKSLYKIDTKAAEEYLIRLSDFLRASISDRNLKMTLLKDEVNLCINYLEMQKIRFNKSLAYDISITDETLNNGCVPSFAIQTLIENAIKHNELTHEFPLLITIRTEGDRIKVSNNLRYKVSSEPSTGSGLANLSERYRIISKDELIIEKNEDTFSVSIKILENADSNNRG